jgi:hypothetical protein
LAIAVRQRLFPGAIVPVALDRLGHDPRSGQKYEGELLAAMVRVFLVGQKAG